MKGYGDEETFPNHVNVPWKDESTGETEPERPDNFRMPPPKRPSIGEARN